MRCEATGNQKMLRALGERARRWMSLGCFGAVLAGCGAGEEPAGSAKDEGSEKGSTNNAKASVSSGPGAAESSASSQSSDGDEEGLSPCTELEDAQCLTAVPKGWMGPVQPQEAKSPHALVPCIPSQRSLTLSRAELGPDASENRYVREVEAASAQCGECEVQLELGACGPPSLQLRAVDPNLPSVCRDFQTQAPKTPLGSDCTRVPGDAARAGEFAMGVRAGVPTQEAASCRLSKEGSTELPEPAFPHYYRICEGTREPQGQCQGDLSCVAFPDKQEAPRIPKVCVYRKGEHDCPSTTYLSQEILYGDLRDSRACRACELEHREGELSCEHELALAKRDEDGSCENSERVNPKDVCLTEEVFLSPDAPWSLLELTRDPRYSGSCRAKPPKPTGKVELSGPITLCCTKF